jgi:putative membrane protein
MTKTTARQIEPKTSFAIGLIWLFNITAIIGIGLGFQEWFIEKTYVNMLLYTVFLIALFPVNTSRNIFLFTIACLIGMSSEWIGVHTSWLFGSYYYGENLGIKLGGVPLLIGVNWAVLSLISADLVKKLNTSKYYKALLAASLMVGLDLLMEYAAPSLDFWYFDGEIAPIKNYLSWFAGAFIIQRIINDSYTDGNRKYSLHLLLSQYAFFTAYLLLQ